jgi:hypothetical protein
MCHQCEATIRIVWGHLSVGQEYQTPDNRRGADFWIAQLTADRIRIRPQGIAVHREAFLATLHYLFENEHLEGNRCDIRSNNDPAAGLAGPLCRAARRRNTNVRCINYVLPILSEAGFVGIDGRRPNRTWLTTP